MAAASCPSLVTESHNETQETDSLQTFSKAEHPPEKMIPLIDAQKLKARDPVTLKTLADSVLDPGFLILTNTDISREDVVKVIANYRAFFHQPISVKSRVDMARTGSNRGWGAPHSEQVDPKANPDYKQVFDCGYELPANDPLANLAVYAPNQWPDAPADFAHVIRDYYSRANRVATDILRGIAAAIGQREDYFDKAFTRPMALLRGNYYPARPAWAGDNDFGIATHTDYGCLTLLATDGEAGLDVQTPNGDWLPVQAEPGDFIVNFGEMLEMWSGGQVRATPHCVHGGHVERISVPLFFNPNHDTNVAPTGEPVIRAGPYLTKRYSETYVHLKKAG